MLLKPGVSLRDIGDKIRRALKRIEDRYPDFVVTSPTAGDHRADSFHDVGRAADIRKRTFHGVLITIGALRAVLGAGFDVVEYSWGYHFEWDPK